MLDSDWHIYLSHSCTFEQSSTPHRLLATVVQLQINKVTDQILPEHPDFLNVWPPFGEEAEAANVSFRQTELEKVV